MRVAPSVTLNSSQRETLQQWARSPSLPARQIERARVVLLAAEGKTDMEIAARLNISNSPMGLLVRLLVVLNQVRRSDTKWSS